MQVNIKLRINDYRGVLPPGREGTKERQDLALPSALAAEASALAVNHPINMSL